jgi:tetratricopeptide (TPR) repeat protein
LLAFVCICASGQTDRRCVRDGNRDFAKDDFRSAAVDYGKAVAMDTTSFAAQYNLASCLYRMGDYQGAGQALDAVKASVPQAGTRAAARKDPAREGFVRNSVADWHFNRGDIALQTKDYASAVQEFRTSLLMNPDDLEAKENYIYAKKMLQNQQGGGGQDQQDQQNQQDQNQQDQQNQQNQQNQQDQQDQDQPQPSESKISPQQAQQMLRAMQAEEKKTQDKVNKEKAEMMQSRQKEKNW